MAIFYYPPQSFHLKYESKLASESKLLSSHQDFSLEEKPDDVSVSNLDRVAMLVIDTHLLTPAFVNITFAFRFELGSYNFPRMLPPTRNQAFTRIISKSIGFPTVKVLA